MSVDEKGLIAALDQVIGQASKPVVLHEPVFDEADKERVLACLSSGWVSSVGPDVDRFENMLSGITGADHVIATVNGTAALHLCCLAAGVRPGDEVIVPPLSFVATANAIAHSGGIPHFVDIEPVRLGLCPQALAKRLETVGEQREGVLYNRETGRAIRAVIVVHVFGVPADMVALRDVADAFGLPIIEDAAEALGSYEAGRHVGHMGLCGALSFNGNKIVTTGGGGAVLVGDEDLARDIRALATTAKVPHRFRYSHDRVAYNYRLPNLNAALGVSQLSRLPAYLDRKRRLAQAYAAAFTGVAGFRMRDIPDGIAPNHWLVALDAECRTLAARDALIDISYDAGYLLRPIWDLLHRLPMYAKAPRASLDVAEAMEPRILTVPSSAHLAPLAPR